MPEQPPFILDDRLQLLANGRIVLHGRRDRIVKLEEKRVSLTAVEEFLSDRPEIAHCVALLLPGKRQMLGCVVVLSDSGRRQLLEQGRNTLLAAWKQALAGQFERITVPRRWRLLDCIPLTRQGKIDTPALLASFRTTRSVT